MSVKAAKLRATLSLFLATFGVYSVSSEAFADSFGSDDNTSAFSNPSSPRATPAPKTHRLVEAPPPKNPYAPGTQNLSVGIGEDFLLGSLGNTYDSGIGPEIHYDYGVSDLFAFDSNFGYQSHSRSNNSVSIWNIAAGLRTNLSYYDRLIPYFNVDLGFFHPSYSYSNNGSASATLFGFQLGLGVDLMITNQLFFGTALTYNDMFSTTENDSNGNAQTLGGAYVSFMIHVGYTF